MREEDISLTGVLRPQARTRKMPPSKFKNAPSLVACAFLACYLASCSAESEFGILHSDEAEILSDVAKELGKHDWVFAINACSKENTSWRTPPVPNTPYYKNQLDCGNCSGGICHVVNIDLRGQNLAGVLPKSIAKLPYLKSVILLRNYLSGTIPIEWGSMSLESLHISINRLYGRIPKQLGNITTLTNLSFENNFFSGAIPAELGKLVNLERLILSANFFSQPLPKELMNLSNLTELRISSNNFSGVIPDYFQSWRKLKQLEIQSSGLMGPIPTSISYLTSLTELKISDLKGHGSGFPPLANMAKLQSFFVMQNFIGSIYEKKDIYNMRRSNKFVFCRMLRSCNITGSIPSYLANLSQLVILDLSFNNLKGHIPDGLHGWNNLQYMYLTSNFLTGSIPDWIKQKDDTAAIDLSYNNFEERSSSCNMNKLNLYRASSHKLNSTLVVCLKKSPCSQFRYSLYINCGGSETTVGKTTYDADIVAGTPAKFFAAKPEWGFSNTGHFWYTNSSYIVKNGSALQNLPINESKLYTEARASAISLTYYGRCLAEGKYTVTLHFAEIVFRDNNSFYSLGRRIFDVYIQEKLVLKDFDIVKAADGTDKIYKAKFKHISVIDTDTIEIRFYYAGKGTTAAPQRGVYGPLISAISVESELHPHDWRKIIKIVIASLASLMALILISCYTYWRHRQKSRRAREIMRELDLQTRIFTLPQIKAATGNFDTTNVIGKGGSGSIYKGTLSDDALIAVKRLSSSSSHLNRRFVTEIGFLSGLHHPNLLRLYGCCVEGSELLLIYEYMVNKDLAQALFEDGGLRLDWPTRMKICVGIARGLAFLHGGSTLNIIHRDIKPTNILLDAEYNAKICDFRFARLHDKEETHISTKLVGTVGYTAPEYALWGHLTFKADVYSFGIVALEIVAGRSNMNFRPDENHFCLLDWAFFLQQKGNLMEIVDPRLESEYNKVEALRMISIALLCTNNASPALSPTMSQVLSMIEGDSVIDETVIDPNTYLWMLQPRWGRHDKSTTQSGMLSSDATQDSILSSDAVQKASPNLI